MADKLRGQNFSSFRAFREAFWRAAIADPELSKQFTANNIQEMKNGRAPFSRKDDRSGGKVKLELHHVNRVSRGGEIYDIENIRIVTPKRHSELHKGGN
ncbi:HNH endonuclease signature motif containing protein [Pseudomonas sp. HLT2-19-2]